MYLYELALELGQRSTDLADRAAQLGFVGLGPSSVLTPEQVAALRGAVPATPPPPTFTGPGPSAPATPPPPPFSGQPAPTGPPSQGWPGSFGAPAATAD